LADGQASRQELQAANEQASDAFSQAACGRAIPHSVYCAAAASVWVSTAGPSDDAEALRGEVAAKTADVAALALGGRPDAPRKWQVRLLRDIFSPFRPITSSPSCASATVLALANAAYLERDLPSGRLQPARLAVLADALEEAGCGDAELLGHLREERVHVRGCWAVDAVLARS
jgi:hypothetical protein